MTSRYLEQLETIKANDQVSTWLLIAAALIVFTLFFSKSVEFPRLRRAVQLTAMAVCFVTFLALLISPFLGAL